jgi:plastocyanin domain-containing protein
VAEISGNAQVIKVFAKNGYSPSKITAKADTETIIRIETNNTYDCSAALVIPSIKYSKFLPTSGTTDIQLLPQKAGTEIQASCSMGMYGFTIEFV